MMRLLLACVLVATCVGCAAAFAAEDSRPVAAPETWVIEWDAALVEKVTGTKDQTKMRKWFGLRLNSIYGRYNFAWRFGDRASVKPGENYIPFKALPTGFPRNVVGCALLDEGNKTTDRLDAKHQGVFVDTIWEGIEERTKKDMPKVDMVEFRQWFMALSLANVTAHEIGHCLGLYHPMWMDPSYLMVQGYPLYVGARGLCPPYATYLRVNLTSGAKRPDKNHTSFMIVSVTMSKLTGCEAGH
jgi:hypothetical protein